MKFDIFGRQTVEVLRADDEWLVFYLGNEGKKRKADFLIPASIQPQQLQDYLADLFHEHATLSHNEVKQL